MPENPFLTIGIVLHDSRRFLRPCLESLFASLTAEVEVLLLDQSRGHQDSAWIRRNLTLPPQVTLLRGRNLGHSGGHNKLMRRSKGRYYACASYDMVYSATFVSDLIRELRAHREDRTVAAFAPRLYRWDAPDLPSPPRPDALLDSLGIAATRGHRFFDLGQGKPADPALEKTPILGPTGALAVYRLDALRIVGPFDETLHHKNDVDLAYRLRWAGFRAVKLEEVYAWHDRRMEKRRKAPKWKRIDSFRAHQAVLKRHVSPDYSFRTRAAIAIRQGLTYCYAAVFEPYLLREKKRGLRPATRKSVRKASPADLESLLL